MRTLKHLIRFLVGLDEPLTQVTDRECELLCDYATRADKVIELGAYEGVTSVALARATAGEVYAIDHFARGRLGICYTEWIAKTYRRRSSVRNLTFINGDSHSLASEFDRTVDMLFIDADHSYDGVKDDWEAWMPKMLSNGIIALHDCRQSENSPDRLGSMQFYEEVLKNDPAIQEVGAVDSLAVFRVK